jgi:hypothetical protein
MIREKRTLSLSIFVAHRVFKVFKVKLVQPVQRVILVQHLRQLYPLKVLSHGQMMIIKKIRSQEIFVVRKVNRVFKVKPVHLVLVQ